MWQHPPAAIGCCHHSLPGYISGNKIPTRKEVNINNTPAAGRYSTPLLTFHCWGCRWLPLNPPKHMFCLKEWISASTYPAKGKQAVPAASSARLDTAKAQEKALVPHGLGILISRAPGLNTRNQTSFLIFCVVFKLLLVSTPAAFHKDKLVLTWNVHRSHLKILVPLASRLIGVGSQSSAVVQTPLGTSNVTAMIAALGAVRAKWESVPKRVHRKAEIFVKYICKRHMLAVTRLLHSCPSRMWWEVNDENSL